MGKRGVVGEFIGDAIMAWWNAPCSKRTNPNGAATIGQQAVESRVCLQGLEFPHCRGRNKFLPGSSLCPAHGQHKQAERNNMTRDT